MKITPHAPRAILLFASLILAGTMSLAPESARADGIAFPELSSLLPEVSPDSALVVVPLPSRDDIAAAQAEADAAARAVDDTIVLARGALGRAQAQVEVKKAEVETVKAQAKAAKEEKNSTQQKDLERLQKELELAQKRLERIRDMRGAEVEFAQAQKSEALNRAQFFQTERALIEARAALDALGSSAATAAQLEKYLAQKREVAKAETRVLEAAQELASKRDDLAGKARALADRRLAILAIDQEIATRTR